jgi:D-alanyl-D-alanine dipeptidase
MSGIVLMPDPCRTRAGGIGTRARADRRLPGSGSVLTAAGPVNHPAEWWHRSFGDRCWAPTTGEAAAPYGPKETAPSA